MQAPGSQQFEETRRDPGRMVQSHPGQACEEGLFGAREDGEGGEGGRRQRSRQDHQQSCAVPFAGESIVHPHRRRDGEEPARVEEELLGEAEQAPARNDRFQERLHMPRRSSRSDDQHGSDDEKRSRAPPAHGRRGEEKRRRAQADGAQERHFRGARDVVRVGVPRRFRFGFRRVEGEGNGEPEQADRRREEHLPLLVRDPCPALAAPQLRDRGKDRRSAEERGAGGPCHDVECAARARTLEQGEDQGDEDGDSEGLRISAVHAERESKRGTEQPRRGLRTPFHTPQPPQPPATGPA